MTPFAVERPGLTLAGQLYPADEPAGAPLVLLLHGYPDTSSVWTPLVTILRRRFQVVTYDVRGAGHSDAPEHSAGYHLDLLMADLGAVLDQVAPERPVHLVGHDWGAVQGWEAVTHPALAQRLASFTAISAPSFDGAGRWLRARLRHPNRAGLADLAAQLFRAWYVAWFQLPLLPELTLSAFGKGLGPAIRRLEHLAPSPGFPAPTLVDDLRHGLGLYRANLQRVLAPRAGPLLVPIQVINGARDPFVSPRIYKDLPAEVPRHILPDAHHWLPRTHPAELALLIQRWIGWTGGWPRGGAWRTVPPALPESPPPELHPRPFKAERPDWSGTARSWIPAEPYASHLIDALSLILPAGEHWFVRVFKQAQTLVKDPMLRADLRGFMGQESAHAAAHAAMLEHHFERRQLPVAPFTRRIERIARFFDERDLSAPLRRRWLELRLAIIASIEHYTPILGQWVLDARALDRARADPQMLRLVRWHGAEEIEHAHVAFAVFHHLFGRHSGRPALARGLATLGLDLVHLGLVTPLFIGTILAGADYLMRVDPELSPSARRGLRAYNAAAQRGTLPRLWRELVRPALDLLNPGFEPAQHVDRQRALRYLEGDPAALGT